MRCEPGRTDPGVPAVLRSTSPARKPARISARFDAAHRRQQRNQLRHGANQMRGVARHQDPAFDRAAPGDPDVAGRQIAQPAVYQLGAPSTGAERQVVLVDQHHAQASRGRVQRDAGPGDAAADHDDVGGRAVGQRGQIGGAARGIEGGRTSRQVSVQRVGELGWPARRRQGSGATICGRLNGRLGDQQHHRGQLTGIAGAHAAVALGGPQVRRPSASISICWLRAQPLRRCRPAPTPSAAPPSPARRRAVARRPRPPGRPGRCVRCRAAARRASASVMWLVSSAASTERVSGQRRYTVGRLTPARRAISASVTRSTPKSTTQLAAAARMRSCTGRVTD